MITGYAAVDVAARRRRPPHPGGRGRPFDGHHDDAITFAAGADPPVGAFWSITLYDADRRGCGPRLAAATMRGAAGVPVAGGDGGTMDELLGTATIGGPVRIGLVSDTHIPEARSALWDEVFDAFRGVDLILHGGDLHELSVLLALGEVAPVLSARGNGEDGSGGRPVTPEHPWLKESWLLDVDGVRLGLTHDLPVPEVPPHLTVERWCERRFATTELDVIVYGHTHVEAIDVVGSTLCVNPGSPTYPRNLNTQLGTIGMLEVGAGTVRASLLQLTAEGVVPLAHVAPVEHRVGAAS